MSEFTQALTSLVSPLWAALNTAVRPLLMNRVEALPVPVISVGNILAGGVGKTEVVSVIAQHLLQKKYRVVISMRGYKSSWEDKGGVSQNFQEALDQNFPDEALVHLLKAPGVSVAVGAHRKKVLELNWQTLQPQVILLDDGFQHYNLKRNLDVLVHDFSIKYPVWRDFPQQFKKVKLCVALSEVPPVWQGLPWVQMRYRVEGVFRKVADKNIIPLPKEAILFCGVGNPQRVISTLQAAGTQIKNHRFFSDHVTYDLDLIARIKEWADAQQLPVLTTLKDYVKLLPYAAQLPQQWGWVKIVPTFLNGEDRFWKTIYETLAIPSP